MPNQSSSSRKSRPVSVRLTPEERAVLEREARGASLSQHIRARLFSDAASSASADRISPEARQRMMAQVLSQMGSMNAGQNLQELAELARLGLLQMTPETESTLQETLREFRDFRHDLLKALGLRPKKGGE